MSLDRKRIRCLCFDVDGTLLDTDDQYVTRIQGLLNFLSWVIPEEDIKKLSRRIVMSIEGPGNAILPFLNRIRFDQLADLLKLPGSSFHRYRLRKYSLIPGIKETLNDLGQYYPMAIVSVRNPEMVEAFLDRTELRQFFQVVATSQTCTNNKPSPDPVLWACDQMGFSAIECLMVGDTTVDILAGKAAGAQTVGVLSGFGERDELEQSGVNLIIPDVTELHKILLT